jgi:hypothetical protein
MHRSRAAAAMADVEVAFIEEYLQAEEAHARCEDLGMGPLFSW